MEQGTEQGGGDPFGAVRAYQIQQLSDNIKALAEEYAGFKKSVVTRVELYLTTIISILVVIIIGLLVVMFTRGL